MSDNLDEKVKNEENATLDDVAGAAGADGESGGRVGKKRGPYKRKGAQDGEKPLTPEPPPRSKKSPEDIKNPHAAIHRCHEEMCSHVANLREMHPGSEVSDPVNPLEVKADKKGAPIEKTAFHGPLIGMCKLAGWLGNLEPEELPKQEDYDRCAESWARTSTHLGLKEKTAALFSSISETVYVVGFTVGRAVKKTFLAPDPEPNPTPHPDAPVGENDMPPTEGA